MSSFIEELLKIACTIIPEADVAEIDSNTNQIRLSWKTNDDPLRRNKRYQPIIIEIHSNDLPGRKFPNHVSPEFRIEFATFIRDKCTQFHPRTTKHRDESHTPEIWIFPPET